MKRSLALILLIFSSLYLKANVRDSIPNGLPTSYPHGWTRTSQQVMADSGFNTLFNDTIARPKYPMIKITTFDSSIWWWNMDKWQKVAAPSTGFVKYSDSTIIFVTPPQLTDSLDVIRDSLGNYVTLYTPQEVKSVKTWDSTQIFMNKVGIGTVPNLPLVVVSGTGKLAYDGIRMTLYDEINNDNILIGKGTGGSGLTVENIGIGSVALKNVTGSNNVAIGFGNLSSVGTVSRNVALGVRSLQLSNGNDNTAVGYFAGVTTFGDSNTVVGSEASAAAKLTNTNVSNSDIVIGTNTYSGSDIATFISDNSLTIGERYSFLLTWNGTIPAPFSTTTTYANGFVENSNTLQFDISLFTSQGSGTTTLNLYNKQLNSIAIGRKAFTDSSNQISLGNASNTVLKANKFVFDIVTTPQNGDVYIYNSALGKFEPASSSSVPSGLVRLTTTQRDALVSPQKGFEIYNITDDVGQMFDGSIWHNLW